MSDIFEEVDEALKQEKVEQWWKQYGVYVVGFCVFAVLMTAGVKITTHLVEKNRVEQTTLLIETIETAGNTQLDQSQIQIPENAKPEDIANILNEETAKLEPGFQKLLDYADDAPEGLAVIARFQAAQMAFEKGQSDMGYDILQGLADDGIDDLYKDYARLLFVLKKMSENEVDYDSLVLELNPLIEDDSPWILSALEIRALLFAEMDKTKEALADLDQILAEKTTAVSFAIQERATKVRHILINQ